MRSSNKNFPLRVERRRLGSPSKLAIISECPLRYLLETESYWPSPLRSHPAIFLGTAVHDTIEEVIGDTSKTSVDFLDLVESCFKLLISEKKDSAPLSFWVLERFGVGGLISRRQLVEQASLAKSIVERFSRRKTQITDWKKNEVGIIPLGSERWLESSSLEIGGRVDLIYIDNDDCFRIVDFKTGKICDDLGNPKIRYLIQLAAYASIIEESQSSIPIQLEIIGKDTSWTGFFNQELKAFVEPIIQKLKNDIPLGVQFDPMEISRIGEHCAQCSFRPMCQAYNINLECRMRSDALGDEFFLPDLCGEIIGFESIGELANIRCKLENGNMVKISRIPTSQLPQEANIIGKRIYAYSLKISENKKTGKFPSNFFVLDQESPRNSAFQAAFFV